MPEQWRPVLDELARARVELARVVGGARPGPLRDRLESVLAGTDQSIADVAEATRRAGEVSRLAEATDLEAVTADYKRAKRDVEQAARLGDVPPPVAEALDSLRRQHQSAQRLLNEVEDSDRAESLAGEVRALRRAMDSLA